MRVIDTRLLYADIEAKLSLSVGISVVNEMKGDRRSTYCEYFQKYIQIQWQAEPSDQQVKRLAKLLARHLDVEEQDVKLVDEPGQLPKNCNAPPTQHNYEIVRPSAVSANVVQFVTDAIVAGAQLKRFQLPTGEIFEDVDCPCLLYTSPSPRDRG